MLSSTYWVRGVALAALVGVAACGSSGGDDDDDNDVVDGPDAAAVGDPDAAPPDPPDAAPPDPPDAAPPGDVASLSGTITRSVEPQAGGVGTIYVAVFTDNPVLNMEQTPVGRVLLPDVDMSASDASTPYVIEDIPLRTEPYHVVAFLDDNATVDSKDPTSASPDMGDLLSMDGLAVPTVVLDTAGAQTFDLDLNFALPF